MSGSLRLLDSDGREILAAIDDQPLRVELVLDEDPKSAPDEIEVQIIGPDGTKRTLTAERIDWGAAQPLYRSDLTTIEDIGTWSVLSAEFSIMDVENRHYVRFEYDDLETSVQVFESGLDAREWVTRSALADDIQQATNNGIALTAALREVRSRPASPERDHLEELIEARLASTRDTLFLLDDASATLNNPNLYAEQQIRGAQYYMNYAESGLDPRSATVDATLDHAKDIVQGHIVSGVQDVVIGGYRMLVQATGVAQARTVLFGEDEMGQEVGWDGRAVAFLDLLSQGLLLGASMKFELDYLCPPSRVRADQPAPRSRYGGPDPETRAPEGSIVDPSQMGMTPEAVRAAYRAARKYNRHVAVRPTNPDALAHLEGGALPKSEALKSKTIGEIDTLLGMAPENRGLVGLFEPQTGYFESAFRTSGMSDADVAAQLDALRNGAVIDPPPGYAGTELWNAAVKRYHQRTAEYNGATGKATSKLEAAGVIRIDDGVIIDTATGKPFTGDHDLYDFIDSHGLSVTPEIYAGMVSYLENSAFRAQHGAHKWWDPQRTDFPAGEFGDSKFAVARQIYEGIIAKHQGEEILIIFSPVGPPIALFAGTAPGPYLGHMPGNFKPAAPGASFTLPTEIKFLGTTGTVTRGLTFDETMQEWIAADAEFQTGLAETDDDGGFDEMAAATTAVSEAWDSEHDAAEEYDREEPFSDIEESDGSTEIESVIPELGAVDQGVESVIPELGAVDQDGIESVIPELGAVDEEADLLPLATAWTRIQDELRQVGTTTKTVVGVGAASLAVAAYILFSGPSGEPESEQTESEVAVQDAGGAEEESAEGAETPDEAAAGGDAAPAGGGAAGPPQLPPDTPVDKLMVVRVGGGSTDGDEGDLLPIHQFMVTPPHAPTIIVRFSGEDDLNVFPDQLVYTDDSYQGDPATACRDPHFHMPEFMPTGMNIEGIIIPEPNAQGCGYGRVSEAFPIQVPTTISDAWEEQAGWDPRTGEPLVELLVIMTPAVTDQAVDAKMLVTIQNVGQVPWSTIEFDDSTFGGLLGPNADLLSNDCTGPIALAPFETKKCSYGVHVDRTMSISAEVAAPKPGDLDATELREIFTTSVDISVRDEDGNIGGDSYAPLMYFSSYFAALEVEKASDPQTLEDPGPVEFTVTIRNGGTETFDLVQVVDTQYGDLLNEMNPRVTKSDCPDLPRVIEPNQEFDCSFVGEVGSNQEDGNHLNEVFVTVVNPSSEFGTASAELRIPITNPGPVDTSGLIMWDLFLAEGVIDEIPDGVGK